MFKLKIQRRQRQIDPVAFGIVLDDSWRYVAPINADRPHWRVTLWLGWFRVSLKLYRWSKQKWSEALKAHGLVPMA